MKLLAVDPGTTESGLAFFVDNKLRHVALVRAKDVGTMLFALYTAPWPSECDNPDEVLIERPVVYPRDGIKKASSLITVAIIAGGAAVAFGCETWTSVDFVEPRTWKRQVPKKIHNERILTALDPEETELVCSRFQSEPDSLQHNVVDAIGIGLYKLGRM